MIATRLTAFHLRKQLWRGLVAAFFMALVQAGALFIFDEGSIEQLSLLKGGLPFPSAMLGLHGSATLSQHLASLCYGFLLPLMGLMLMGSLSARLLSHKVETGEMAYYLALPLRRGALVITAFLTGIALIIVTIAVQSGITLLAAHLMHPDKLNPAHFLMMNLGLLLQKLLALCMALAVSAGQDERVPARRLSRALMGLFFLISLLSRPSQMPGFLRYLGLFALADHSALAAGRLSVALLILPAASILFLMLAIRRFSARDLAL